MQLSKELRQAIKLADVREYKLAQAIGMHPSTLSGWTTGALPVREGDPRVLKLADLLGVDRDRAFEADPDFSNFREVRSLHR